MRHFLTLLIIIVTCNTSIAQNLSLTQLLELRKKDLGNADEYLTAKGWEFLEANEPADEKLGSATFTYKKDDMSDKAESFLTYMYSNYSLPSRISIQINKKIKYTEYINTIKNLGCKLISSKVEDGELIKIYRGVTTTFKIRSSTSANFYNENTAVWHLFIATNEDYDINWGE